MTLGKNSQYKKKWLRGGKGRHKSAFQEAQEAAVSGFQSVPGHIVL